MSPEAIAPAPEGAEVQPIGDGGGILTSAQDVRFLVRDNGGGCMPPVTLAIFLNGAHISTYLTPEEAHIAAGLLVAAANRAGAPS